MASANLGLVRSIYADWERGEYGDVGWADPEIEFVFADGPTPATWTGLDAMADAWRESLGAWKDFRTEADDYRELDEERVLVLTRNTGRGRGSGLELDQMLTRTANLFHVREGRVTKLVIYFDRQRALADLGLAPEANTPRS